MKKRIILALVVIIALVLAVSVFIRVTDGGLNLKIITVHNDGSAEYVESEKPPFIKQTRTMMPITTTAKALGLELDSNTKEKTIAIYNQDRSIKFWTDSAKIEVDGGEERLLLAPEYKGGVLFVPFRFVCDRFGTKVFWEDRNLEHTSYMWTTSFELLSRQDFQSGRRSSFEKADGVYTLKAKGRTYRGVRLGMGYDEVIEAYGEAHKVSDDGKVITYYGLVTPENPDVYMEFYFENDTLVKVNKYD